MKDVDVQRILSKAEKNPAEPLLDKGFETIKDVKAESEPEAEEDESCNTERLLVEVWPKRTLEYLCVVKTGQMKGGDG